MHSAPSVSYPVGRSRSAAAFLLLIWLLAAIATASWWLQVRPAGWRQGAAALLLATVGLLAAWNWRRTPSGTLAWDGESWSWAAQGVMGAGVVSVRLDFQRWLLLRWTGNGASRWLWLERAHGAQRWDDLRRAVYSRAGPPALPGAQPPPAKT